MQFQRIPEANKFTASPGSRSTALMRRNSVCSRSSSTVPTLVPDALACVGETFQVLRFLLKQLLHTALVMTHGSKSAESLLAKLHKT